MSAAAGIHRFSQLERVLHGRPVADALADELALLGAARVLVVCNRSVVGAGLLEAPLRALGARHVGTFAGVTAHAPRGCALAAAQAARDARADLLLAVGGGSVIDAAKAALLILRHGYDDVQALAPHANVRVADQGRRPVDADRWLRVVAVPTTLSGAEFTSSAGLTDPVQGLKHSFVHPMLMPVSIVLDAQMTRATPPRLLLASGIKAVDHAAERMTSAAANPYSDAVSEIALRLLSQALPRIHREPQSVPDLDARADALYGVFMSLAGAASGVSVNVSHAIGHVLGAHAGVPHGETSCVMLPAVLQWNADATAEPQRRIREAMGGGAASASVAVADLVRTLGLPSRLSEVGVHPADHAEIARKTMHEHLLRASRKAVDGPHEIERILALVA